VNASGIIDFSRSIQAAEVRRFTLDSVLSTIDPVFMDFSFPAG
jgi:hypothetical protein